MAFTGNTSVLTKLTKVASRYCMKEKDLHVLKFIMEAADGSPTKDALMDAVIQTLDAHNVKQDEFMTKALVKTLANVLVETLVDALVDVLVEYVNTRKSPDFLQVITDHGMPNPEMRLITRGSSKLDGRTECSTSSIILYKLMALKLEVLHNPTVVPYIKDDVSLLIGDYKVEVENALLAHNAVAAAAKEKKEEECKGTRRLMVF